MKISILAVGTELTTGQIINKNAAWLSQEIQKMGLHVLLHLTVPDDRDQIREGLDFLSQRSDILLVTGGLGPTQDDFTRDVISEWSQRALEYDAQSWEMIHKRLTERGYAVKDIQKQQCYYPQGSKVLANQQGTANGFVLDSLKQGIKLAVLPGPPREIAAIWHDHLKALVQEWIGPQDPKVTLSWDTLGRGESDIAGLVNSVVISQELDLGYRVHLPYVEVKLTYLMSQKKDIEASVSAITQALDPWIISKNGEDPVQMLIHKLNSLKSWTIHDASENVFLYRRLSSLFAEAAAQRDKGSYINYSHAADYKTPIWKLPLENEVHLSCIVFRDEIKVEIHSLQINHHTSFKGIYTSPLMKERNQQYLAEMTLLTWLKWLQK